MVRLYRMFDRMYEDDELHGYDIADDEIADSVLPYIILMQDIYSRIYRHAKLARKRSRY